MKVDTDELRDIAILGDLLERDAQQIGDAADELDHLRKRNAELEAALKPFAEGPPLYAIVSDAITGEKGFTRWREQQEAAQAALKGADDAS